MTMLKFPGDSYMLGASRFRIRRIGRDEWLNDQARPTEDVEEATMFATATEAALFMVEHLDEARLWHWEEFFTIAA